MHWLALFRVIIRMYLPVRFYHHGTDKAVISHTGSVIAGRSETRTTLACNILSMVAW